MFELSDATFNINALAKLQGSVNLRSLFSGNQTNSTNLDYSGSMDAYFPLSVGVEGTNIGIDLNISDENLFSDPSPTISYELKICEVVDASKELFRELTNQILDVIESPLKDHDIGLDIDKITQPLVDKVNDTLSKKKSWIHLAAVVDSLRRGVVPIHHSWM
jgi:hypothetical protein